MRPTMTIDEWMPIFRREYLERFIPEGGSTVKFVADLGAGCDLVTQIIDGARAVGQVAVTIDAGSTSVQHIERWFTSVAAQLDWRLLTASVLDRFASSAGWPVPGEGVSGAALDAIATANRVDRDLVRMTLDNSIATRVLRDQALAHEFRIAMTWLCRARLLDGPVEQEQAMIRWLRGEARPISTVKAFQLYTGPNRSNARSLLESLFTWVHRGGFPGTTVVVDGRALTADRRAGDLATYTRSARLDAYELLRQFIDATDRLSAAAIVVVVDAAFLDQSPGGVGAGSYQALNLRTWDEVHDRTLPNPLASLVRIGAAR